MLVRGGVEDDVGPHAANSASMAAVSRMSASGLLGRRARSVRPRTGGSRRGRRARSPPGRSAATWRAISAPIDPPPPVTSTRRPRRSFATSCVSMSTWSRPRRSSMLRSRASRRRGCPPMSSSMLGRTFTGTPAAAAASADPARHFGAARRDRQHDLVGLVVPYDPLEVVEAALDPYAVERPAPPAPVVVDHRHRPRGRAWSLCCISPHQLAPGPAGADHDHPQAGPRGRPPDGEQAGLEAHRAHERGGEQGSDGPHRDRHRVAAEGEADDDGDLGGGTREQQPPRLLDAGVLPHVPVRSPRSGSRRGAPR